MSLTKAKLKNKLWRTRLRTKNLPALARANLAALDHLDPKAPAGGQSFAVLDLETTGMDTRTDKVVSVGAVRLRGGRIILGDSFSELINPGREIPAESIKFHGITPSQVLGARRASDVFVDFLEWLGPDILVAHYAPFDLYFINFTMDRLYGFPLQNIVLDTVRLCRAAVLPSDPYGVNQNDRSCTLDTLCTRFGIGAADRHTSMGDALATAMIFQRMLTRLKRRGLTTLRDLVRAGAP